jgi:cytochrome c oxidase subunit 3
MADVRVNDIAVAKGFAGSAWNGGVLPYDVGHKKLGMWLFIMSDSLTFSALLVGYSYLRVASENWPAPFHLWPSVTMATLMTVVLLSSSVTMALAVAASKAGARSKAIRYILFTILGGLVFLVLHINEWLDLMHEGLRLWTNPWGVPLFGATFFAITGLHMLHVATGAGYLAVVAARLHWGRATHEDVEISGLYWHFVDLVWMFVFPLIYLLSVSAH